MSDETEPVLPVPDKPARKGKKEKVPKEPKPKKVKVPKEPKVKIPKLTKKQFQNLDSYELRRLAVLGMQMPDEVAYNLKPSELLGWVFDHVDRFPDAVVADCQEEHFRPGVGHYLRAMQAYLRNEGPNPDWPPVGVEEVPQEQEVVVEAEPELLDDDEEEEVDPDDEAPDVFLAVLNERKQQEIPMSEPEQIQTEQSRPEENPKPKKTFAFKRASAPPPEPVKVEEPTEKWSSIPEQPAYSRQGEYDGLIQTINDLTARIDLMNESLLKLFGLTQELAEAQSRAGDNSAMRKRLDSIDTNVKDVVGALEGIGRVGLMQLNFDQRNLDSEDPVFYGDLSDVPSPEDYRANVTGDEADQ